VLVLAYRHPLTLRRYQSFSNLNYSAPVSFKQSVGESPLGQLFYWLLELACRFAAGVLAGFLGGYASHLVLDAFTPSSLPLVC
jgi:hypothetical protein